MKRVFTNYLSSLTAAGEPPGIDAYDEVCGHLRAVLITELRRRGLWSSLPSFVGIPAASWQEEGALEELVFDAYAFIFIHRLNGLTHQLEVRSNVDGLIIRNVRHFITERQRKADPLGYRVYDRLRGAVERLLELGHIHLRGHSPATKESETESTGRLPRLHNNSVLAFENQLSPLADPSALTAPVSMWNNRRMPELVTAEGRGVPRVIEDLADDVASLQDMGIRAFRFQHLAKALKDDARGRWQALWQNQQETAPVDSEPGADRVPYVVPNESPDWPRFQAVVLACVEQTVAAVHQAKRQRDLWTVWLFLRGSRVDAEMPQALPGYSELGRQLQLPRERASQMLTQLKDMVQHCLRTTQDESEPLHSDSQPRLQTAQGVQANRRQETRS